MALLRWPTVSQLWVCLLNITVSSRVLMEEVSPPEWENSLVMRFLTIYCLPVTRMLLSIETPLRPLAGAGRWPRPAVVQAVSPSYRISVEDRKLDERSVTSYPPVTRWTWCPASLTKYPQAWFCLPFTRSGRSVIQPCWSYTCTLDLLFPPVTMTLSSSSMAHA